VSTTPRVDQAPLAASRPQAHGSLPEEFSLYDLINVAVRHRYVVLAVPLLLFAVVVTYSLLRPRSFTASAWFMPQEAEASNSRLLGIAAQFGLAVPAGQVGQSPTFYAELLKSREILAAVVDSAFRMDGDMGAVTVRLVDLYRVRKGTPLEQQDAAVDRLKRDISAEAELQTGLVKFEVRARHAPMALQIAQQLLAQLSDFNLKQRRSQATAERQFIAERLAQLRAELSEAEARHQAFLKANREFRNAPHLLFENDRLAREVTMRQQIYTGFAEEYERAKINEVRDTPVITVVQAPRLPTRPSSRHLLVKGMLSLVIGLLMGLTIAFAREFFRRSRMQDPAGAARFAELRQEAIGEIRNVLGQFGSRRGER